MQRTHEIIEFEWTVQNYDYRPKSWGNPKVLTPRKVSWTWPLSFSLFCHQAFQPTLSVNRLRTMRHIFWAP
jgi:hypothetical protein